MAAMSYDDKRVGKHVRAGFSLMEIMIAVMILGLVAALVGPKVFQMLDNAKKTSAATEIKTIKGQLTLYRSNMGSYPQKLKDLVEMPKNDERAKKKWQGPYLDKVPEDPWGAKYHYKVNAEGSKKPFELISYGPEGKGHKEGYIDVWAED